MRNKLILMAAILTILTTGCATPRTFGPYYGKVVDPENNEPLEGAVVAVWYSTESPSVGGPVGHFADAVETLTDAKGEFHIPSHWIGLFKFFEWWNDHYSVAIFKPGYAAYPGNSKTYSSPKRSQTNYLFPEDEYIMVYLPKLKSFKERKDNLFDINQPLEDRAIEKMPNLRRLDIEEGVNIGLQPPKGWKK
jgi:protocatechuate 3,4-dioxygenase beta subunit